MYASPAPVQGAKKRLRNLNDLVMRTVEDLSRDLGKTFATEKGFAKEIQRRTGGEECSNPSCECHAKGGKLHGGYRMGDGSFRKVRLRLQRAGVLGHERIAPGRPMVHGTSYNWGGQHNWLKTREEQRKARRLAREEVRQERDRHKRRGLEEKRQRELRTIEARAEAELASRSAIGLARSSYELPATFLAFPPPKDETAEQVARRDEEIARQITAAKARADLWPDDEARQLAAKMARADLWPDEDEPPD